MFFLKIFLLLLCFFFLVANFFGLPGNWFILGVAILAEFTLPGDLFFGSHFILLFGLAVSGEIVEFILGVWGTKRYGGSKWGILGSIVGGIIGAVIMVPLFFGFGAFLGVILGSFVGSLVLEYLTNPAFKKALQASKGAVIGRILGTLTKLSLGLGMVVVIWQRLF